MTTASAAPAASTPTRMPAADIRNIEQLEVFCKGLKGEHGVLVTELEDAIAIIATVGKMNDPAITGPLQTAIEHAHGFQDAMAAAQRGIASHEQGKQYVDDKGVEAAADKNFLATQ